MPFCIACGDYFSGRGTHCPTHNPHYFNSSKPSKARYVYDADADITYTSPHSDLKYRTGQGYKSYGYNTGGAGLGHTSNRHYKDGYKSYKFKPYDTYDDAEYYDGGLDARGSGNDLSLIPGGMGMGMGMKTSPALVATAQAFRKLTSSCEINSMNLHMHPTTSRPSSLSFIVNKDREQCLCCKLWFPDRHKLKWHQYEFPSGCDIHEICFGREEEHYHGTQYRHERCFVKGCTSVYRREGGWKAGIVEGHVREWHWGG